MVYLVESVQKETHTALVVYSRDKDGKKNVEVVHDFLPYFYVSEDEPIPDDIRIVKVERGFTALKDSDKTCTVNKIYVKKSNDIRELKEMFDETFEADIMIQNRYIIDEIGEVDTVPLKILSLDIELNVHKIFPNLEIPDKEVTSICMKDSFENKEYKIILYNSMWSKEIIEELEKEDVIICKTEEQVLGTFVDLVDKIDPDVITGWNVDKFDLTYLVRRMMQLDVNYRRLSPLGFVRVDDRWGDVTIKGRIVFDLMENYKYFRQISNQGKAESYSLEYTSQEVLGESKIFHKQTYAEMWKDSPVDLIKYNVKDVDLVLKINETLQLFEFFDLIRAQACVLHRNIQQTTVLVDGFLLRRLKDEIVLPSKKQHPNDTFDGAYVVLPEPGIYKNVLGLDVLSMYPNIIKTFNVGYETLCEDGEIFVDENSPIRFKRGTGIIAGIIKELEKKRKHYKKLKASEQDKSLKQVYHFRQYAIKVIMNSFFGFLGSTNSRLYKPEIASAICTYGRKLTKYTIDILNELGYKTVYGDTDSTFVQSKKESLIDILKEANYLVSTINEKYKEFAYNHGATESYLEMEFEKAFRRILFVPKRDSNIGAKKRYAYTFLWADKEKVDNKVHFTGLDVKRSDVPRVARNVQEKVLNMILNDATREEVTDYLKEIDRQIRNREILDSDIGFPKEIKNSLDEYGKTKTDEYGKKSICGIPPIVAGALYSNKYLGTRFTKGNKPKFMYIKRCPKGYPETKVISYEEDIPEGFEPDYEVLNQKIFKDKLERIFKVSGFGEFPTLNSNIKTLDQWG